MCLEGSKILECFLLQLEQQQMAAQCEPDFLIRWRERAGAPQQRQRLAPGAQPVERFRLVEQCLDGLRRELRCMIEGALCLLELFLPEIEMPQAQIGLGPVGLEAGGVVKARFGAGKIAFGQLQCGDVVMCFGRAPGARASAAA